MLTFPPLSLASNDPAVETVAAVVGGDQTAARGLHSHPRPVSAGYVTLDGVGQATVTYTREFDVAPAIILTAVNPSGLPVTLEVVSHTIVGGKYVGCVIKGYRSQSLPGVIVLLNALQNFNVFGASASGVNVSVVAVMQS